LERFAESWSQPGGVGEPALFAPSVEDDVSAPSWGEEIRLAVPVEVCDGAGFGEGVGLFEQGLFFGESAAVVPPDRAGAEEQNVLESVLVEVIDHQGMKSSGGTLSRARFQFDLTKGG